MDLNLDSGTANNQTYSIFTQTLLAAQEKVILK